MSRVDEAGSLFTQRYSCSQAVFAAYAPTFGVARPQALRLASALGGGLRAGGMCGAAAGALLVLGLARCDEECSPESRHRVMGAVDDFYQRFRERVGALDCPDILGCDVRDPRQRAVMEQEGLRESVCLRAVRVAAEILEELLEQPAADPEA